MGMVSGSILMKNNMEVSQKSKSRVAMSHNKFTFWYILSVYKKNSFERTYSHYYLLQHLAQELVYRIYLGVQQHISECYGIYTYKLE